MVLTFTLLLELIALAFFIAAAAGISARINLTAAGLATWMLSILLGGMVR